MLVLYGHPFSSYTQKVLIALYENATAFTWHVLDGAAAFDELAALWPLRLMPVLVDGATPVVESSIIIEHLALHQGMADGQPGRTSERIAPECRGMTAWREGLCYRVSREGSSDRHTAPSPG